MYSNDSRIVVTLDAGGTNFVFGAMRGNQFIVQPIDKPSNAHNLDLCLATLVEGFSEIMTKFNEKPAAISFAFPGPADYPNGIIGGYLPNFPSFRDGVALGPFLEEKFGIPVFINNDADLYVYGEAIAGALPEINAKLRAAGSVKQYRNLLGYTWGTGFGIGIVTDGKLHIGDNSCVETFCLRHKKYPDIIVEDGVAARALRRVYGELSGDTHHQLEPYDIFKIAEGMIPGDREAAVKAFEEFGEISGDAMATAVTLIDGLIVIGGGIVGGHKYIMPALLREMRGKMHTLSGDTLNRVQMNVYDLDDDEQFEQFTRGESRELKVYGSDRVVNYDPEKRIGIVTSKIGASNAISIGAYSYALATIDRRNTQR
ncbi:MAG: ROK family protein [Alistipes sp.]|nr:ROK family protein [Alistipes sp.]